MTKAKRYEWLLLIASAILFVGSQIGLTIVFRVEQQELDLTWGSLYLLYVVVPALAWMFSLAMLMFSLINGGKELSSGQEWACMIVGIVMTGIEATVLLVSPDDYRLLGLFIVVMLIWHVAAFGMLFWYWYKKAKAKKK